MASRTRRILRTIIGLVLLALLGAGTWLYLGLTRHADLSDYAALAPAPVSASTEIRATFLGVSTILLDDGETKILTDGFFTRPNPKQIFLQKIAPDPAIIAESLARAGITRLAAVIVCHSHYDHAMDAPLVAIKTGAVVVGSSSTANIARGGGVAEDQIRVPAPGEALTFGKFRVTLLRSEHVPTGFATGEITEPLRPPVRASDYREGGSYAVLVEHGTHSLLINASAGFTPGALAGRTAETVFLGIGQLGKHDEAYMQAYWREVVASVHARRVIAVHWDNFTLPLDRPLQPIPRLFDDLAASMHFLTERGRAEQVDVRLPAAWSPFDPLQVN
jgi:L-ascorbate metabolism protein UlaG (beta-lactamase superfamily)